MAIRPDFISIFSQPASMGRGPALMVKHLALSSSNMPNPATSSLRPSLANSVFSSLLAIAALVIGMLIASHHPLTPTLAMAGCATAAALCLVSPNAWLVLLPALLPVVDLAPWTGWLTFEEFDILVLGAAAGAWLRHAWLPQQGQGSRPSITMLSLTGLMLLSLAVALVRGIEDAGGLQFGWFHGYESSMNSLRLAKSFILAALFAPLLAEAMSRRDSRSIALLAWGMALGLATAALAAIWERLAFPGLLDFSSDYRTTALFWEMHVGGAALDGFLALTVPFAVLLLLRSHSIARVLPAAAILALGAYASLTTFSRGVYLAAVASLGVMALVLTAQTPPGEEASSISGRSIATLVIHGVLSIAATLALSYLVFRSGGYRALSAVLGSLTVFVLAGPTARAATLRIWGKAILAGALLAAVTLATGWLTPKGAYWAFAAVFGLALFGVATSLRSEGRAGSELALAAMLCLPVAAAQVAGHWGGPPALVDSAIALALVAALSAWNVRATQPILPIEFRRQSATLVGAFSLAAATAVFGGGSYIGDRFSTSQHDFSTRLEHWDTGLHLLHSPSDWLLGKGLGRFPSSFLFGAPGNEFPGTYRLNQEEDNTFLSLSGPRYQIGFGELLRTSQRIHLGPPGRYHVEFDGRAPRAANVRLGICTKHLLYAWTCAEKQIRLSAAEWQHQAFDLDGRKLTGGPWYAPQLAVFSVTLETLASRIDVDNLTVTDSLGRSVLANGNFSSDMARWFFTSDHHHMPWHMKNLFLHVLFEQGIVGLAIFVLMILAALMRSLVGPRAHHPFAPGIVAAIVGFLVVGLFDSLLDVPRVAFLFFLLLLVGIQGRRKIH
jgi:hypothetical protein